MSEEYADQLNELKNVNQRESGLFKRVFRDGENDLVLWYTEGGPLVGFQLTIGDIAVTYVEGRLTINAIDFCEKDNLAPVLRDSVKVPQERILRYIEENGALLEPEVKAYLVAVIQTGSPPASSA